MPSWAHISSTASARLRLDERRDRPVEHHPEAGVLDPPAHDAERVGPELLGRAPEPGKAAFAAVTTAAAAPSPNSAVATIAAGSSLSSRIEIEQVSTVTNSQLRAGSDAASRAAVRKAADAAGAAEPEDRHAPDVGAKAEPRPDPRLQARVAMPVVDTVTTPSISLGRRPAAAIALVAASSNICSAAEIDRVALGPAVGCFIPFERSDQVALGDRRHCRTRRTTGRTGFPPERPRPIALASCWFDHMGGNRSGERE